MSEAGSRPGSKASSRPGSRSQSRPSTANSVLPDAGAKPSVDHAATAQKLQTLLDGFAPFDDAMKLETKLRQEKDARKVAAMKAEMLRLEGLLKDQVQITASQNRSLQKHCDAELIAAKEGFVALLEHQDVAVHARLDTLDVRADQLEERFAREKARIEREVEEESQRLSRMLDEFQEAFEEEVRLRKKREEQIRIQMDQHEGHLITKFDAELEARTTRVAEIQAELAQCVRSRVHADVALDRVCAEEVATIQRALDDEVAQRERQDDAIIRALDQYTDKMQSSLGIINSTGG